MSTNDDSDAQGPFELLEAARTKYTLAQARLRRGPPELALLSMYGSLEDALRADALRRELPAAVEPFLQLLETLVEEAQPKLSAAEGEGIRRMHRLRARVAHGEQIAVTHETIEAYQRLVARLLPRYGVLVVAPEAASDATPVRRETAALARRERTTGAIAAIPPPRERTSYPDDSPARYTGRPRPSGATSDLPLARELAAAGRRGRRRDDGWSEPTQAERLADFWSHSQRWLLPSLIILTIFLIGAVISIGVQQLRNGPLTPTAAVVSGTEVQGAPSPFAPQITTVPPTSGEGANGSIGQAGVQPGTSAAPTSPTLTGATVSPAPPGELAPGRQALVRLDVVGGLNLRARPGTAADNPVLLSLGPGTLVEVVAGPSEEGGFIWWQVRATNVEGWCAGEYLEVR